MSHFDTPSSGIKFESPLGVNAHIRRDEGVPGTVALLVEEELDIHSGILGLDGGAGVANGAVSLGGLGFLEPFDDVPGTEVAQSRLIFGLAHLDHPDEVALEVPAVDELEQFSTREPAVNQQVVKADTLDDGSADHLDGVGNLGLEHLLLASIDLLLLVALLAILGGLLLLGKPLWFAGILAGLCLYGGIHHQLGLAVRIAEEHGLEAQDTLHRSVRKHLPKALGPVPPLGEVGVIEDKATGSIFGICPAADKADQLAVDGMDKTTPVDATVIHQAVERVLLAGKQLAEGAVSIVRRCLDGEERIQDEQSHQLDEGELAVRILNRTHRFGLYDEPAHLFVYRVDRLTGVIMSEKVFEFRNYLSIFVHG